MRSLCALLDHLQSFVFTLDEVVLVNTVRPLDRGKYMRIDQTTFEALQVRGWTRLREFDTEGRFPGIERGSARTPL